MGVFTRMIDLANANINAALDKAEQPEKMLRLITQDMEGALGELRSLLAQQIAEKKSLQRQSRTFIAQAESWQQRAEQALGKQREDLARQALNERQKLLSKELQAAQELEKLEEQIIQLQVEGERLSSKLAEVKQKQTELTRRENTAAAQLKSRRQQAMQDIDGVLARFDRYQQKVERIEAEVESYQMMNTNLEREFQQLQHNEQVEAELAALKQKSTHAQGA